MLDACLIVKNEAHHLPGCLDSLATLRPLLGRIHVYDTGSTDATIAIARERGCDVMEGFWDDDFARARNESLAPSQAIWALMIDADERVAADPARLRRALESASSSDLLTASLSHLDESGRIIGRSEYEKVIRVGQVEFHGRVHETVHRIDGEPVRSTRLDDVELHFRHLGYATADIRQRKAERNAYVSRADVADAVASGNPERMGVANYHHARSLARLGAMDEALAALEAARAALPAGSVGHDRVATSLVGLLLESGRADEAAQTIRAYLAAAGAPPLARLLLARIAMHTDRPVEALSVLAPVPEGGAPERDVEPSDVLRLKIDALDRLGRHDEALAACFVLVTRWHDAAYVPALLVRVAGQDAGAVASVIAAGDGAPSPMLLEELRRSGPFGAEIAARLA